jgi:poly(beta-D-mannuronate) lyase
MTNHRMCRFIGRRLTAFCLIGAALSAVQPLTAPSVLAADAPASCPSYPPVINVGGTQFYTDTKGSQVNRDAEQKNNKEQAPITDFLTYELDSLDGAPSWSKVVGLSSSCANSLLENWAKAGAFATTNDDNGKFSHQGGIDRQSLVRSMVIVALKLKVHGLELGPDVAPWLGKLVTANNRDWQRITLRSNLYYWAGVTAAAYALLTHDQASIDFQNQVWAYAMSAIRDDGYLDSELARGSRALIYHQYALSALLTLREARLALGIPVLSSEQARLKRLADRIGHSLCHPDEMAATARVASEEMPGDWGFREIAAYGGDLLDGDWQSCGVAVKNAVDINNGGDQLKTRDMFHALTGPPR